ncbi:MAG: hypothetical protein K6C99_08735 [Lachnospiraceae bacterium]|nr:hypothetical protein [Lachnospiraceae bacterium]
MPDIVIHLPLSDYVQKVIDEKELKLADVARDSSLSEGYVDQISRGLKSNPTRDEIICLAFGLKMNLPELHALMQIAGVSPLSAGSRKDSIVYMTVTRGMELQRCKELLAECDEEFVILSNS